MRDYRSPKVRMFLQRVNEGAYVSADDIAEALPDGTIYQGVVKISNFKESELSPNPSFYQCRLETFRFLGSKLEKIPNSSIEIRIMAIFPSGKRMLIQQFSFRHKEPVGNFALVLSLDEEDSNNEK